MTPENITPEASNTIQEEDEGGDEAQPDDIEKAGPTTSKPPRNPARLGAVVAQHKPPAPQKPLLYKWKIDLSKTEPFWVGWFQGMSQKFIDLHVRKVLLLANLTMDTALTRAQMEGKFQFQVLHRAGHTVQEDQPENVADIMANFLVKHRLTIAKGSYNQIPPQC